MKEVYTVPGGRGVQTQCFTNHHVQIFQILHDIIVRSFLLKIMSSIINFQVIKLAILRAASNTGFNNSDHNWNSKDKLDALNNLGTDHPCKHIVSLCYRIHGFSSCGHFLLWFILTVFLLLSALSMSLSLHQVKFIV